MRYLTEIIELKLRYEFIKVKETEKAEEVTEREIREESVNYTDSVYADCLYIRSFISRYIYFIRNELIS